MRRMILPLLLLATVPATGCTAWNRLRRGPQIERGREVFVQKSCHGCHTVGVVGTPIAPDLGHIGAQHPRSYLEDWLRDPTAYCPSHMPRVEMSEDQLQALAEYLSSLR